MSHSLCHGGALDRLLSGLLPIAHGFVGQTCQCAVVRHQFRSRLRLLREALLQGLHNPAVKLVAFAFQQALVRSILDQGMLEHVGRSWRGPAAEDQLRFNQPAERILELVVAQERNRREQLI